MSSPPTKYVKSFDYAASPTLNTDFDRLKTTTDQTIDRLAEIQRDDGKLKDGAITTNSLLDGSVTEPKLATGAVSTRALADGSVTGPKLAPGSIPPTAIQPGSIGSTQLLDGGVQTVDLADLSVTQPKLSLLSVGTPQLIDASVTPAKLAPATISAFAPMAHTHPESDVVNLIADLALKAPLASPALSGVPTAPTPATGTNTTQLATTAFVAASMSAAGAITEAPNDGKLYGRQALGWQLGVKLGGDTMTGPLVAPAATFGDLTVDANINGPAIAYEINRSAGANARTGWLAFNNLHYGGILQYGPNYGPSGGPDRADGTSVTATGTGGMSHEVSVAGAPYDVWLGGLKKMSLDATTGLLVGTDNNNLLPVRASNISNANKIINGDFRIHQRGALNTVYTAPAGSLWVADRWAAAAAVLNKVSFNCQNTPGAQNTARLLIQSLTNNVPALGDQYYLTHKIEGNNCNDLEWGGATAKPITVSFMAYVNNAGAYGGAIHNGGYGAAYRNYPFSFNLTANAWNKVVVTIPGDGVAGAGGWGQDNNIGMMLILNLGTGSNYLGPANVWGVNFLAGPTGAFNMLGITGAVMYLANVKIETGNVATPFVPDDMSVALTKCKRYYQTVAALSSGFAGMGHWQSASACRAHISLPVTMRGTPSIALPPFGTGPGASCFLDPTAGFNPGVGVNNATAEGPDGFFVSGTGYAGMTAGVATMLYLNATRITCEAEL